MLKSNIKQLIYKSILAGSLIGFAACIFARCQEFEPPIGKLVGASLFSIGLIAVILLDTYLFTGKIGYVNSKQTLLISVIGLLINLLSAFLIGLIYRYIYGVQPLMATRLLKPWYRVLVDGVGCGVLIYLAVELYKRSSKLICIILPVIAFILAGFEHCIATVAYLGMSTITWRGVLYIILIAIGNAAGSLLIRLLQLAGTKSAAE